MKEQKTTGRQFIAETLRGYGVSHVFYVEAMLRMTAIEMRRLGIERIITHSEKAAAYMADGYARVSGRPGVCMAQSVGAANLAAGLQDAYLAGSPVVALTGKKPPDWQYRNAYQEIDHEPLFRAVTKFHGEVATAEQLPILLRHAFRTAVTGSPGPVHLDLPNHTGRTIEQGVVSTVPSIDARYTTVPPYRPAAESDLVAAAAAKLAGSERPVIVAGGGARVSDAGEAIIALARSGDIPVVTSADGKGVIDETDPLWAGIVGGYSMACANRTVHRADLVLFIGSGTGDQVTFDWRLPEPGTSVIQIDIDPVELGRNYPGTLGLAGDARVVTGQLAAAADSRRRPEWLREAAGYVQEWFTEHAPLLNSTAPTTRPERLCAEIERILPKNGVVVADTGYSAIWASTMIRIRSGQTFLRAAGSLGWAYPASLGAACGAPDRPVICFTGDGAFYYHLAEMETAARYGIRTVTVVNNNQAFSQGVDEVKRVFAEVGTDDDPNPMFRFTPVNIARVAKEFGMEAFRVENASELPAALEGAMASDRPAVVEVCTDIGSRASPAWLPS